MVGTERVDRELTLSLCPSLGDLMQDMWWQNATNTVAIIHRRLLTIIDYPQSACRPNNITFLAVHKPPVLKSRHWCKLNVYRLVSSISFSLCQTMSRQLIAGR